MQRRSEMDSDDEGAMEDDDLEDITTSDLAVGIVPDLSVPTTEARTQLPINEIEYKTAVSSFR